MFRQFLWYFTNEDEVEEFQKYLAFIRNQSDE
jgi:hypothetical protein